MNLSLGMFTEYFIKNEKHIRKYFNKVHYYNLVIGNLDNYNFVAKISVSVFPELSFVFL